MPDMSQYSKSNLDDSKRKKRLARNRASARLRRLRKKNLVESYEAEVGVLRSSLEKLEGHRWGRGGVAELLEGLSMDRGQQAMSREDRVGLIRGILEQQYEQVDNLLGVQLEGLLLGMYGRSRGGGDAVGGEIGDMREGIYKELDEVLKLTPSQIERLGRSSAEAAEDRKAAMTVEMCLRKIRESGWMQNETVEDAADRFMKILNPGQMSKFLLWTDNNSEQIESLDYVNAPAANAEVQRTPRFFFGTEGEGGAGEADEGAKGKK